MNQELLVNIGTKLYRVFLQDGFFQPSMQKAPLHKHNYPEIHIVADETTTFKIGNRFHSSKNGNILIIPKNVFHCVTEKEPDACHIAFQVDCDIADCITMQISPQTVLDFSNEIKKCRETNRYTAVSAYISLFICQFFSDPFPAQSVTDYRFLICEFLSKHYHKDLQLSDLAKELHLSTRQAERLVIKYTGHTFREELTTIRMCVATHLLDTTTLSLTEVSRYVGYRSYAGFWKALKRHKATARDVR